MTKKAAAFSAGFEKPGALSNDTLQSVPIETLRSFSFGFWSFSPCLARLCMAITGSLLTQVSDISAGFAVFWLIFLTSLYLLWSRLPLSVIRGALWIGLVLYQLRWGSAWLVLPPAEAPIATIAAIVYTPMLLMIFGLMEGQRRGVIVGITVLSSWASRQPLAH